MSARARIGLLRWVLVAVLVAIPDAVLARGDYPPSIIPADAPWSFRVGGQLDSWVFRVPDDLGRLTSQPEAVQTSVQATIGRIEANRQYIRRIGRRFFDATRDKPLEVRPDYARHLETAAISVSFEDSAAEDPLWRHRPVIDALPSNSKLLIRAPEAVAARLRGQGLAVGRRFGVIAGIRDKSAAGLLPFARPSRWIRDAFVVAASPTGRGESLLLLPPAYFQVDDLPNNDLGPFESSEITGTASLRLPVFIRAGNLHAVEVKSRHLLFVGERESPFHNEVFRHATGAASPPTLFGDVLRRIAGSASIIELPNSDNLFHIDMVVGFPRPGLAAIIQPLDPDGLEAVDRRVIDETRGILEREGFQVLPVPTTADRIRRFQSPVNFVAYRDRRNGQYTLILPEFSDMTNDEGTGTKSLNATIRAAFVGEGLAIKPVEDRFHLRGGNVHCALQALK